MKHTERLEALAALGKAIRNLSKEEVETLALQAYAHNTWFTPENVQAAFTGIAHYLQHDLLREWANAYPALAEDRPQRKVGIVMAGNIPMVGFHDLLTCLLAGQQAYIKFSSQDQVLMNFLIRELQEIAPELAKNIVPTDRLSGMDAIIATGSDNTSRYFEYYFRDTPHIIRKGRSSCAILRGSESNEQLRKLGVDIFRYYGLGCRNVSKLFVPKGYNFEPLFEALQDWNRLHEHHKYTNNYDYNKSIFLINKVHHLDTGFALFTESKALVSPISVVHYETYTSEEELNTKLAAVSDKLQCIVGEQAPATVAFGKAQQPEPWEYADGVDTMAFLLSLS